jgi:SHS2 domain-containing protein
MYRWVDHTAEVELAIEAGSEREVFADALAALAELLGFGGGGAAGGGAAGGGEERSVLSSGPDRAALLASFVEELVFLAESEGFVATALDSLALSGDQLEAVVTGLVDDPPPLVKAVTYHGLTFDRSGPGYVASVVLDV